MSTVTGQLPANPSLVFDVMSDARVLRYVVAGTRAVRRFSPRWPEVGSDVHHEIGVGPLVFRDCTVVRSCTPRCNLLLEAHAGPLGTFSIEFTLRDEGATTALTIVEDPLAGPFATPRAARFADVLITMRNRELLRRLRHLVERRERQRAAEEGRG